MTVTLTALPEVGFVFDHWQGDASGTEPEVTLVMDGPKQVMAVFVDVAPPEIAIQSPLAGVTDSASFVLSGTVTDNLGVGSATWEWNGQPLGYLPLNGSQFYVDGLQWVLGENRIRIVAVDLAGNEASTEIVVEWVPARLLSVVTPFPRQEGERIRATIQLSSSGDVGGASFVLRYNPAYLKHPSLEWSPSVQSALNQVNTDIPGEVRATFALPATAVPAGTRNLAVVTFRARSVPETLTTGLELRLLDVSDPSGNSMALGSAVRSGQATILVRRVVGDNNANDRLDVGDATLIQRLLTGIDPVRFWDRSGNDVNENTALDSGDVIRVLRAVVRLDPQPAAGRGRERGDRARPREHGAHERRNRRRDSARSRFVARGSRGTGDRARSIRRGVVADCRDGLEPRVSRGSVAIAQSAVSSRGRGRPRHGGRTLERRSSPERLHPPVRRGFAGGEQRALLAILGRCGGRVHLPGSGRPD